MPDRWTPYATYEEIVILNSAGGIKKSTPSKFRNKSGDVMLVDALLFDPVATSARVRWGIEGGPMHTDPYAHMKAMHNTLIMNAATDCAWPMWKLRKPIIIPPRQGMVVELEDSVAGGARNVNVSFIGKDMVTGLLFVLTDRVTVPSSGSIRAEPQTHQDNPVEVHDVAFYVEETGTAAKMRGLHVKVKGGGLPDWSDERVPASMMFPHRNGAAHILAFPGEGLVLPPGKSINFEFHDNSGGDVTVYVGMVGYLRDRRA